MKAGEHGQTLVLCELDSSGLRLHLGIQPSVSFPVLPPSGHAQRPRFPGELNLDADEASP